MATVEYRNKFFSCAIEIIRSQGAIGPTELSRRTGTTPQSCYIAIPAWPGITAANEIGRTTSERRSPRYQR